MDKDFWELVLKFLPLVISISGIFVGIALERFKGRTFVLDKTVSIVKNGNSFEGENIGTLELKYNGENVDYLYVVTVVLENTTWRTIDEFNLQIGFGANSMIYKHSALQINEDQTNIGIGQTDEFLKKFDSVLDEELEPLKSRHYNINKQFVETERIFKVPYVNKNQKLQFDFLVGCKEELTNVFLNTSIGNLKMQTSKYQDDYKKQRTDRINKITLIYFVLFSIVMFFKILDVQTAVVLMFANVFVSYILAGISYYTVSFLKNFFIK